MSSIRRVLIANRGEIAVRIVRACRTLGVESVAVASDPDRNALHARTADLCENLGGASPAESYLRFDAVLDAAKRSGADAIHPGYGFLAENAPFARAVEDAGLIWIGPSPEVIEQMGIKTTARARMIDAGVPVVPGATLPEGGDDGSLQKIADGVGYPLLVKAAAGGGGKGMRSVASASDLLAAVGAARREAAAAFADPTVYLERQLIRPRHVEVQIFGDRHGTVLHLGERDCSLQRRHQKVIEESPAPGLEAKTREAMWAAAVEAARAVGYVGAGTVEMLLDESGDFYFLEMNTRLQVEHPVTELVTQVDLVAEQIRVAEGAKLSFTQEEVRARGHAFEARLYAEDPASGFLPQTGEILLFEAAAGPGVRVDAGVSTGDVVSLHYDPMLAKICSFGRTREEARLRMVEALRETVLLGVGCNASYLRAIVESEPFAKGAVHTGFLAQHLGEFENRLDDRSARLALAAAAALFAAPSATSTESSTRSSVWAELDGFDLCGGLA